MLAQACQQKKNVQPCFLASAALAAAAAAALGTLHCLPNLPPQTLPHVG
jgi:hypothetical protein